MTPEERATASQARVDAARRLTPHDLNVWKHYEDRADQLGGELWTVGSWLSALIGGALTLPFAAGFITTATAFPYLQISNRVGVGVVSVFGLRLCRYAYEAVHDVRDHIESNWRKAGFVLQGSWQTNWAGRKGHGWNALMALGWLATAGFVTMLVGIILWPA